jgi:hypothetical protein
VLRQDRHFIIRPRDLLLFFACGDERKGASGEQGKFIDFWKTSLPWHMQFDEISGRD